MADNKTEEASGALVLRFVDDWRSLVKFAGSAGFLQTEFRVRSDKWAKMWSRLPYNVQGEISHQIGCAS